MSKPSVSQFHVKVHRFETPFTGRVSRRFCKCLPSIREADTRDKALFDDALCGQFCTLVGAIPPAISASPFKKHRLSCELTKHSPLSIQHCICGSCNR